MQYRLCTEIYGHANLEFTLFELFPVKTKAKVQLIYFCPLETGMLVYRPEKGGLLDRYLDFDKFDVNIYNKVRLNMLDFTLNKPKLRFNLL